MKINFKERPSSMNTSRWIWRYMNLSKLISLIQTESLYFIPLDRFDDKREGMFRSIDILAHINDNKPIDEVVSYNKSRSAHRNFASCWFKAEYESVAMWSIYGNHNDSIAIQSDLNFFKNCIIDDRAWTINIDKIIYVNWTAETKFSHFYKKPDDDELFWFKDKSYEYENEWRFIINFSEEDYNNLEESEKKGLNIKIDTNKLIERIYVCPNCSNWKYETLKALLIDYGITAEVSKSRIV